MHVSTSGGERFRPEGGEQRRRRVGGAVAWLALVLHAGAAAQALPALSFQAAQQQVLARSDKLGAARAAVQSKELQLEGVRNLGGPSLSVSASHIRYEANANLSLSGLNNIGIPLPLPSNVELERRGSLTNKSLIGIWPLYLGGATDAARGLVHAQADEARADATQAGYEVQATLAKRYFAAQLAARAWDLRREALRAIGEHDRAAERMMAEGTIARVERLQARVALEDARREERKAQDTLELAQVALGRTLRMEEAVRPSTPLFILTRSIEPLSYFLDAAMRGHPALGKVAAKEEQARQLHAVETATRRPQVFAFGGHQIRSENGSWLVGVGVRWTLWDSLDRPSLDAASDKTILQAQLTEAQARQDISLLVESKWRAVDQARRQFLATGASVELADEVVRLRASGLREGVSTATDLIDAETNRAKVQTERAQAAYDYIQSLAELLEASGLGGELARYIERADVRLPLAAVVADPARGP